MANLKVTHFLINFTKFYLSRYFNTHYKLSTAILILCERLIFRHLYTHSVTLHWCMVASGHGHGLRTRVKVWSRPQNLITKLRPAIPFHSSPVQSIPPFHSTVPVHRIHTPCTNFKLPCSCLCNKLNSFLRLHRLSAGCLCSSHASGNCECKCKL